MIQLKKIKNTGGYFWTEHAQYKMRQYGLSEQRIRNVLRNPFRREEGIVKNTIAVMQPVSLRRAVKASRGGPVSVKKVNNKEIWKQEIWAMFQKVKSQKFKVESENQKQKTTNYKLKIISVWRYPGVSPKNNPIPEDILREISQPPHPRASRHCG